MKNILIVIAFLFGCSASAQDCYTFMATDSIEDCCDYTGVEWVFTSSDGGCSFSTGVLDPYAEAVAPFTGGTNNEPCICFECDCETVTVTKRIITSCGEDIKTEGPIGPINETITVKKYCNADGVPYCDDSGTPYGEFISSCQ